MEISADLLLKIIGEFYVKTLLLESELGKLQQENKALKEEGGFPPSSEGK